MFDYHHWLNRFPGTNFHELNIDWLVEAVKGLAREMYDFEVVNSISYEGAWDIHKQYKKYAIVTDDNKAYISIDLVPAGVQIDNPDYWVLVANFTQEIADLGNRVIALEQDMDSVEGILSDNQIRSAKYAIWIGDSYTGASSLGSDIDKRFSTLVSGWLGLTEKNYAVGGNGVLYGTNNYPVQLTAAINDFNNNGLDKSAVKYVFISSCRNDTNYGTRAQFRAAVQDMVSSINTNFPNAEIYITPLLWDWKTIYFNSRLLDYISEFQFASHNGKRVHIINYGYEWLMGRLDAVLWQNGGDVHPTVFGHKIIADHIYSAVKGEDWRRYEFAQINPTTLNGIGDFQGFYEMMDGYVNLNFEFTVNGGSDITTGTIWELAINSPYFSSFFITDQGQANDIYFDIISRDLTSGVATNCKAVLRNSCSKTDTAAGSYLLECKLYGNGSLVNSHRYYARLRIPFGRRNYPTWT